MNATMATSPKMARRGTDRGSRRSAGTKGRHNHGQPHASAALALARELDDGFGRRSGGPALNVLQLDVTGLPQAWITPEEAASHIVSGTVAWYAGETPLTVLRGGINAATGTQSMVEVPPILALRGQSKVNLHDCVPVLTNQKLFRRDRMTCIWCAGIFKAADLTREHIVPTSRGGRDIWANVGSACRGCNSAKSDLLAEELGWEMVYAPYVPSLYEDLLLRGRNIRADVHEWLASKLPKGSRLS